MKSSIAKDGFNFILPVMAVSAGFFYSGHFSYGLFFLLTGISIAFFFRDPKRDINSHPKIIVAAADGKIKSINEIEENLFLNESAVQIITSLSITNVHINRAPLGGVVDFQKHIKGRHHIANKEKAANNEKNYIGIQSEDIKILVTQIAGIVARRIVSYVEMADEVYKGEKLGLIRFGSRTDVTIPKSKLIKVLVRVGDKTKAGETAIALIE